MIQLKPGSCRAIIDSGKNIEEQLKKVKEAGANLTMGGCTPFWSPVGLEEKKALDMKIEKTKQLMEKAHNQGVIVIGYIAGCDLYGDDKKRTKFFDFYDNRWKQYFQKKPDSDPIDWTQKDIQGNPIEFIYKTSRGYSMCVNNPDWRTYIGVLVKLMMRCDIDGFYFDDTLFRDLHAGIVGCYCKFCMQKLNRMINGKKSSKPAGMKESINLAMNNIIAFKKMRVESTAKFIGDMRGIARRYNSNAIVFANNSLNSPHFLYQDASFGGVSIDMWSKEEDAVLIEDGESAAGKNEGGNIAGYSHMYRLLRSFSHNKPIFSIVLKPGYKTPMTNSVKLSMAEAAVNDAIYVCTAKNGLREVCKYNSFFKQYKKYFQNKKSIADVAVYFPSKRYLKTEICLFPNVVQQLIDGNIQCDVITEEDFNIKKVSGYQVLIIWALNLLSKREEAIVRRYEKMEGHVIPVDDSTINLEKVREYIKSPTIEIPGCDSVRAFMREGLNKTLILYLLNYNISARDDKINEVKNLKIRINNVPSTSIVDIFLISPDSGKVVKNKLNCKIKGSLIEIHAPRLKIFSTIIIKFKLSGRGNRKRKEVIKM